MANYPSKVRKREELNLRLGIKSSLSQLRSVVASLYVIYIANKKQSQVIYSQENKEGIFTTIKLDDNLSKQIDEYLPIASNLINKSPLFTSQLEALQVGIELFFHLAKVNFVATGLSERTGSSRYQKKLSFAINMVLIDLYLSSHSSEDVKKLLVAWLKDEPFPSKLEEGLKVMLNTFTEETQFKIRNDNRDEIIFNQEGVYDVILNNGEVTSKDANEPVGPFRIYKSFVSSGMHPFLIEQRNEFKLKEFKEVEFETYFDLVKTALDITPVKTYLEQEVVVTIEENKEEKKNNKLKDLSHQRIYYGAPGTGKSHGIKELIKDYNIDEKTQVFRTTFHPDSDYSTFVGAYKPTMKEVTIYHPQTGDKLVEDKIVYTFTPQSFLKAYIAAWNALLEGQTKPIVLVIEEINRGNCAQIFGDLFQLLDRDENGVSEYPIKADDDLFKVLQFGKDAEGNELLKNKDGIANGELCLPSNLYIWATMNTSDQSLFPIDSAFKRRWDWVYMPIKNAEKGWVIKVKDENGTKKYDWWEFIQKINAEIDDLTNSEDKKLGYFFCKAKNKVVSADMFVNKVMFYLWNDVVKDYDLSGREAFQDDDGKVLTFGKFYENKVRAIEKLMENLKVTGVSENGSGDEGELTDEEIEQNKFDYTKYRINGGNEVGKSNIPFEAVKVFVENRPELSLEDIVNEWAKIDIRYIVETEEMHEEHKKKAIKDKKFDTRSKELKTQKGILFVSNQIGIKNVNRLIDQIHAQDWGINIEKI